MDDYISRQAAIDLLKKWSGGFSYIEVATNSTIKAFEEMPSADVQPVRHGRWLDGNKNQPCSVCKYRGKKSWNYCPNCGARMNEERKE